MFGSFEEVSSVSLSFNRIKEEVYEAAQHDRKQIERKVEKLEDTYYRTIRTFYESEKTNQ
ncbi:hypothetical protein BCR22_01570 [Enterococcus plantarum]|nr:hypothetical protein BCR22_01570 [Enterococcus plantarum]